MDSSQVAFLPVVRKNFDIHLAEMVITEARHALMKSGFNLVEPVSPIDDLATARGAAQKISTTEVDLVILFQATFADSTMVVEIAKVVNAPLLLWAVPEEWSGERLRLNSLCGINLAAHALTLRKIYYDYVYALPQDPEAIETIHSLAKVGALRREMRAIRLGIVGEYPAGMDTCRLNESGLREKFGVHIVHIPLPEVFEKTRSMSKSTVEKIRSILDTRLENLALLDKGPLNGTLSVYQALRDIAQEKTLAGLAVRCWPEFFTDLGCAACGAMSLLSDGFGMDTPLPCSCEADINGTLTQWLLQTLAEAPAFGTDIVGVDAAGDRVALWHCGLAPLSMANPAFPTLGGVHSNRGVPLVMDFPLKPGEVTIARLSQATGELRLILGRGEMLAAPKPFRGTAGTLKLDLPARQFLDLLMREGLEHHISIVYGDYLMSLLAFARMVGIQVLSLTKAGGTDVF